MEGSADVTPKVKLAIPLWTGRTRDYMRLVLEILQRAGRYEVQCRLMLLDHAEAIWPSSGSRAWGFTPSYSLITQKLFGRENIRAFGRESAPTIVISTWELTGTNSQMIRDLHDRITDFRACYIRRSMLCLKSHFSGVAKRSKNVDPKLAHVIP